MNSEEAVILTRYVKACCPQQQIDAYTPDAWYDLLSDLDLGDCRVAVAAVARRQPFVAPAEIREEVRRTREDRIGPAGPGLTPVPPPAHPDAGAKAYLAAFRQHQAGIADGHIPRAAIIASSADPEDNPTARTVLAKFQEARAAAERRKVEQRRADREALKLYLDAVDVLFTLDDQGAAALATAREHLLGDAQAAAKFPDLDAAPGMTDGQKITIWAARIVTQDAS